MEEPRLCLVDASPELSVAGYTFKMAIATRSCLQVMCSVTSDSGECHSGELLGEGDGFLPATVATTLISFTSFADR